MNFGNPVEGPRVVAYGEPRKPTDVLPNGRKGFRVTQRFSDVNPQFPQFGQHHAMDVGNFVCGDNVLAMAAGTVANVYTDDAGAKIVLLNHGQGFTTLYAHLSLQAVKRGTKVFEGQLIGKVGDTGLGAVCHLHVEVRHNNVKVDPWPLLRQTQELPDTAVTEDEVDATKHIPIAFCRVASGGTVYADPAKSAVLIQNWIGQDGVGLYAKPTPGTTLVPIRIDVRGTLHVGYVGWDKVSSVRVPVAL